MLIDCLKLNKYMNIVVSNKQEKMMNTFIRKDEQTTPDFDKFA